MTTASDIITDIVRREGDKYTNHAADKGGPTKYGITQRTLSDYRGRPVTPDEVAALTETEARSIYLQLYVRGPGFNKIIDPDLTALAVDCGVNHGQKRAVEWLQELVGARVDGNLGPATADAINKADAKKVYLHLIARRCRFYGEIISRDWRKALEAAKATPGLQDDMALTGLQAMFAGGWLNRASEFIDNAAK